MGSKLRSNKLSSVIQKHYKVAQERSRLYTHAGQLEFSRTKELISRYLSRKSVVVLDIGGGPGAYACWLAGLGHTVHLVDPVPLHLEQAKRAWEAQANRPLASITLGDARNLRFDNHTADVVLLLGPLYHLFERRDRIRALSEAFRVLRRGGLLFAAAISRFASALDGLFRDFIKDPEFFKILRRDLKDGQHRNVTDRPEYFTAAFFHHPNELKDEILRAGFEPPHLYGIEGPGWLLHNFQRVWKDSVLRARVLTVVKTIETEPAIIGLSAHILAVARKRH
jgi:ubiquinone/menaquinone biosynthesis C-methylase UbiE